LLANILSSSSLFSSDRGSWKNMQSSPLMQFPVVWYNLHGKPPCTYRQLSALVQKQVT
jgi:hypothetical protein